MCIEESIAFDYIKRKILNISIIKLANLIVYSLAFHVLEKRKYIFHDNGVGSGAYEARVSPRFRLDSLL